MNTPEERRYALEQVRASHALDGHYPSAQGIIDGERWVNGEITIEEWLKITQERYGVPSE